MDAWEDENSLGRCTATHVVPGPDGDASVRCDGQAGHSGPRHQGHLDENIVEWTDDDTADARAGADIPADTT